MRRLAHVTIVCAGALIGGLLVAEPQPASGATWGPDVRIAYAYNGDIFVAHPSGASKVNITDDFSGYASGPSLSRTGRYVTFKVNLNTYLYDFQTDQIEQTASAGSAPDISPVDDTITYNLSTGGGKIDLYTAGLTYTDPVNRTNETAPNYNLGPTFAADGKSLIYTRSHGTRVCREDMGGFDDVYYAYRLYRFPLAGGAPTQLAGDNDHQVVGGAEGPGVLAYVRGDLPPTDGSGYCATTPTGEFELVVNGAVVGPADADAPSVNGAGDVAYSKDLTVMVDPAGTEGPTALFPGWSPDWGVAFGPSSDCTIEGTEEDDRLEGTAGPDVICGLGGDDMLFGLGGDDVLRGGDGEDGLVGGPGDDSLFGGLDTDVLRGDEGDDLLDGGEGIDLITYFTSRTKLTADLAEKTASSRSHGKDTLVSIESVFGSKTGDQIKGDGASNALYGGPGSDSVTGGGGTDLLIGNAGSDRLLGGSGNDLVQDVDGEDTLDGQSGKDTCYADLSKRDELRSCERVDKKDPKKTPGPRDGDDTGTVGRARGAEPRAMVDRRSGATYWNIGNDDYLFVYSRAATASIGAYASATGWENRACYIIRLTPARGACSAVGALNAVQKYQMAWFLWNAQRNGGCAIGILDWGRHGVNQFKKRWKVRSADYARYNVAIPWVTAGRFTDVKANGYTIRVTCS